MSNTIRFLELMGQDAELRYSDKSSLYQALNGQQINAEAQWAILRGDIGRLEMLLGARKEMVCSIQHAYGDTTEEVEQVVALAA